MMFNLQRVVMFRYQTTRKNIRYSVVNVKDKEDVVKAKVYEVVIAWVEQLQQEGVTGKAIIYADSIKRVERLGKKLGCLSFFSSVNLVKGKSSRLKDVIIAINTLRLGVDIPDVWVVIHTVMP
ncbi:hypothetical protein LZ31DRAFT_617584, partial [Colletotrichum somersetense]